MDWHQWRSQLAEELAVRRVPSCYSRRLLRELEDHLLDLQEAEMHESKEAENTIDLRERLGDPAPVAAAAATATYPRWYGRHPWLAFVLGSPLVFFLCVVSYSLLVVGLASLAEGHTVQTSPLLMQAFLWASRAIAFVPAIGAAVLLCWLVGRSGRHRLWAVAACGLVALLAGCLSVSCTLPQTEPGTGDLTMSFGVGGLWQTGQTLAPLIIGAAFALVGRAPQAPDQDGADAGLMRAAA